MSIALMNAVWKSDLPSTRKFVALSLADQANDMGECYPSIPMIAERCSLSDRAVRGAIRELEQAHVIRSEMRTGRSTVYVFSDPGTWCRGSDAEPRNVVPGGTSFPRQEIPPTTAGDSAPPRNVVPPTPERGSAITTKEPKEKKKQKQKQPSQATAEVDFVPPEWIDPDAWAGYLAMRKKKRAPPTLRACQLVVAELDKLRRHGHDPTAALDQSTRNSWTDVYPVKGQTDANRNTGGKLSAVERVQQAIDDRNREREQVGFSLEGQAVRIAAR